MSPFAIFTFKSYVLSEESQFGEWSVKREVFPEIMKKRTLIDHSSSGVF